MVEEETLPEGFVAVFFKVEYCLLIGVPEAVLAARILLIKLPEPILVGGVSVSIEGYCLACYEVFVRTDEYFCEFPIFERFLVADGV